ncbi:MAG: tail fiber domain-containing protein [Candidatus Omnitrophota bacterium]
MKNDAPLIQTFLTIMLMTFTCPAYAGTTTMSTYFPSPSGNYTKLSIGTTYTTATVADNNLQVEGNIGIGTTTAPTQKLDISGKIAIGGVQVLKIENIPTIANPNEASLTIGNGTGTGRHSTYVGLFSGASTGVHNTAVGYGALQNVTTGQMNVAIGANAMNATLDGTQNVAVGEQAMQSNVSGNYNVAVGKNSLFSNISGHDNTAYGYQAMYNNTTNHYNAALGAGALYTNQTGANNVAIGYNALNLTTASDNIALGYNAGSAISSGTKNIVIGKDAAAPSATGTEQLVIGSTLYGTNIYNGAGAGTGNIGISVQAPAAKLDVAGDIKTSGNLTAATGNVTSVDLTATGNVTLGAVDYSKTATVRGTLSVTSGNGTALLTPASQTVASVVGNYLTITMPVSITTANIVGANNISMVLSGDLLANGYYHSSDERLKTNIQPITNALAKIRAINGVTYAYKAHPDQPRMGLIAQNVEKVAPELVATDAKGMKSVEYGNLVGLIVEGIKEQQQELDAIDRRIAKLEMK